MFVAPERIFFTSDKCPWLSVNIFRRYTRKFDPIACSTLDGEAISERGGQGLH